MHSKKDIQKIEEFHKEVFFLGTPEKGYTDSGFWKFLPFVYTKDEHDLDNPEKPLLGKGDEYLIIVFLYMLACSDLLLPKSRQIRMSWAICAFIVWLAMSGKHRQIAYQTKKEEDAFAQTSKGAKDPRGGRMDFILQTLPKSLRDPHIISGKGNLTGKLVFSPDPEIDGVKIPWSGSRIFGLPQGGDQCRQYTLSAFASDESAFQDQYRESLVAAGAAVTGGKMISASSIQDGSYFNECVLNVPQWMRERIEIGRPMVEEDGLLMPSKADMSVHQVNPIVQKALDIWGMEWQEGMRSWETLAGSYVLEVHHTADPKKDPRRDGLEWYKEAVKKDAYKGDYNSQGWQVELNVNYGAGGGDPVFPFLRPGSPIFVDAPPTNQWLRDGSRFFAGYDFGSQNPAAFEVIRVAPDGTWWSAWEVYEPCRNMADHVKRIKRCPYWDRIEFIKCDPSIMAKTQFSANDLKTLAELFEEHGLYLERGRRGQDVPVAMRLKAEEWADPENPRFFLTKATPNLNREMMGLKWEEYTSTAVELRRNAPEKIRQKDNHGFDAICVCIDGEMSTPIRTSKKSMAGTFAQAVIDLELENKESRGGINVR